MAQERWPASALVATTQHTIVPKGKAATLRPRHGDTEAVIVAANADAARSIRQVIRTDAAVAVEVAGSPVGVHGSADDALAAGVKLAQQRRNRQCGRRRRRRGRPADPLDGGALLGQQCLCAEIRRRSV